MQPNKKKRKKKRPKTKNKIGLQQNPDPQKVPQHVIEMVRCSPALIEPANCAVSKKEKEDAAWFKTFMEFWTYVLRNECLPQRKENCKGVNLFFWFYHQRRLFRQGRMPIERAAMLDGIIQCWTNEHLGSDLIRACLVADITDKVLKAGKTPLSNLSDLSNEEILYICKYELATCEALLTATESRLRYLFPGDNSILNKAICALCYYYYKIDKCDLNFVRDIYGTDIVWVFKNLNLGSLKDDILKAFSLLPYEDQELVQQKYVKCHSYKIIGQNFGISGEGVRFRSKRIKKRMRHLIDLYNLRRE